jgi:alkylation response protein AidB-like acyl-CoA dehydrogenase
MRFLLEDVIDIQSYSDLDGFSQLSPDLVDAILEGAAKFSEVVLFPLNSVGDRQGCVRNKDGSVKTPDGFPEAYKAQTEGGWAALSAGENLGGQGLPDVISIAVKEMSSSANMAFSMYAGLTHGAVSAILASGSQDQIDKYVPKMVQGEWGGTMALTEPVCGTDLGLMRSKAVPQPDGSYKITGQKIWISGAKQGTINYLKRQFR